MYVFLNKKKSKFTSLLRSVVSTAKMQEPQNKDQEEIGAKAIEEDK